MSRHEEENSHERSAAINRRAFVVSGVVSGALAVAGSAIPRRADAAPIAPHVEPQSAPE